MRRGPANVLHRDLESRQQLPTEVAEEWFSHSFTIGGTREDAREGGRVMATVVTERNALIHRLLAAFDPGSLESCESLCLKLDEQRSRIRSAYERLPRVHRPYHQTLVPSG